MEEFIELMGVGILVFLIFLGMASPVIIIGLIYFLKKRLDHKQVMAAIEKGTPLSDLKPPKRTGPLWIKNLTAGIALLIISVGIAGVGFVYCDDGIPDENVWGLLIVALILFAIGVSRLIRGLLQRKTEKAQRQIQPSNQINPAPN
jgi:hypothetical protein